MKNRTHYLLLSAAAMGMSISMLEAQQIAEALQ